MKFKVMLTGSGGMLGQALRMSRPEHAVLQSYTKQQLDISYAQAVEEAVQACRPHVIINAAAYTQVDKAEEEPEKAYAVNCDGALHLARAATRYAIPLLHVSTDYVFDGVFADGLCRPYTEEDVPTPSNVYGASKLAGEKAIQQIHEQAIIVRSSSLFSFESYAEHYSGQKDTGKQDFVSWVLSQAQRENKLKVLDSWVSCPTPVKSLSAVLWQLADRAAQHDESVYGVWHYAGTPAVSRYLWARQIIEMARQAGVLKHSVEVQPCSLQTVIARARRPVYSALDCEHMSRLGIEAVNWTEINFEKQSVL